MVATRRCTVLLGALTTLLRSVMPKPLEHSPSAFKIRSALARDLTGFLFLMDACFIFCFGPLVRRSTEDPLSFLTCFKFNAIHGLPANHIGANVPQRSKFPALPSEFPLGNGERYVSPHFLGFFHGPKSAGLTGSLRGAPTPVAIALSGSVVTGLPRLQVSAWGPPRF